MFEFADIVLLRLLKATCYLTIAGFFVWLVTRNRFIVSHRLFATCHWLVIAQGLISLPLAVPLLIPIYSASLNLRESAALNSASSDVAPSVALSPASFDVTGKVGVPKTGIFSQTIEPFYDSAFSFVLHESMILRLLPVGLTALWVSGMVLISTRLVGAYFRLVRSCDIQLCETQAWIDQWDNLQQEARLNNHIRLFESSHFGPGLCRFPTGYGLIVPTDMWGSLSSKQRACILEHELAHYLRGDVFRLFVSRILAIVHWFNPIAWWSVKNIEVSVEWAADEAVRRQQPAMALELANTLLDLSYRTKPVPLGTTSINGGSVGDRIRRLVSTPAQSENIMKKCVVVLPLILLLPISVVQIELVAQQPKGDLLTVVQLQEQTSQDSEEGEDIPSASTPAVELTPRTLALTRAMQLAHDAINTQRIAPKELARDFAHFYLDPPPASLVSNFEQALKVVGVPKSLKSAQSISSADMPPLISENQVAYRFHFDTNSFESDLGRFVDVMFGDQLYEDMLDGIRDDPNGPQVDMRKDLFANFRGELIIVNDVSEPSFRYMLAIPIKDEKAVAMHLKKITDFQKSDFSLIGSNTYRANRTENNAVSVCQGCLIMGELDLVLKTLGREQ